jgi:hypothetical protein
MTINYVVNKEVKMYTLYFNRSEKVITVKKAHKALQKCTFTEEVTKYNACYYLCAKRKPLIEKAKEIHRDWITQLEDELNTLNNIKF